MNKSNETISAFIERKEVVRDEIELFIKNKILAFLESENLDFDDVRLHVKLDCNTKTDKVMQQDECIATINTFDVSLKLNVEL